jgi:glycosyltransferase involved in cell wall biosynthesis
MKQIRVVVISGESTKPSWRWIAKYNSDIDWLFFRPQADHAVMLPWFRLWASIKAVLKAAKSDVLVSHGPYMAFYCALLQWCFRIRTPHICYSFNFSQLPSGFTLKRMQFAFAKMDKLVVSSQMEIALYAEYIKIPAEKFDFVRWGVSRPEFNNVQPKISSDYICAVGGNARDYQTFLAVMADLPTIPAIMVVRPHNLIGLQIPGNVTVLTNIPKDEAYSVIAYSRFMVLPLTGNEIPCGHVTLVVSLYLGVPTIVTDSSGIGDYIVDEETGLLCAPHSTESMREAILRLWQDGRLCSRLAGNGKVFAETMCSEQNYVDHFKLFVDKAVTHHD